MSDLSREFKLKLAGVPFTVQIVVCPLSRDDFKVTASSMLGTYTIQVKRTDWSMMHGLCNAALCTDGPVNTDV